MIGSAAARALLQSFGRRREDAGVVSALSTGGGLLAAIRLADALLQDAAATYPPSQTFAAPAVLAVLCAYAFSSRDVRESRDPMAAFARVLGSLHPETGVRVVFRRLLKELLRLASAREVVVAFEHRGADHSLLVSLVSGAPEHLELQLRPLSDGARSTYFFSSHGGTAQARTGFSRRTEVGVAAFDELGPFALAAFRAAHPCARLHAIQFRRGDDWEGRVFVLDPADPEDRDAFLRTLELMLQQLLPAVFAVCDLHALREAAAAQERARLGRELHDGTVQGLLGIELELEAIRRGMEVDSSGVAARLGRLQERLRSEVVSLRVLGQQARSRDVEPSQLPGVLEDIVNRFERESGIAVNYVSDVDDLSLPARVCGEIVRIVQEALVNVHRHSGARQVVVRLACDGDDLKLCIEDDGRGFLVAARAPHTTNTRIARAPAIIDERVQAIGGRLRVASATRGARLEVTLPRRGPWRTGALFES